MQTVAPVVRRCQGEPSDSIASTSSRQSGDVSTTGPHHRAFTERRFVGPDGARVDQVVLDTEAPGGSVSLDDPGGDADQARVTDEPDHSPTGCASLTRPVTSSYRRSLSGAHPPRHQHGIPPSSRSATASSVVICRPFLP